MMPNGFVDFIFVVHNHQPVGNFDHVFAQAADDAYIPFLKLLMDYPEIKVGMHTSGCLWEWLAVNRLEYVELCRELVSRGQVELVGGGFYEPILTLLPERDIARQFERMSRFMVSNFGVKPEGFWCTERVWEPSLPYFLRHTGMKYTLLDDNHFISAGLFGDELKRLYRTGHLGCEMALYPISEKLRYYIPFKEVRKLEELFRSEAGTDGALLVFGDDGEKFGVWPGTVDWVWTRGWIRDFFDMLKTNKDWIRTRLPGRYLADNPPADIVFLPATSYRELTGWALPGKSAAKFESAWKKMEKLAEDAVERRFFRGGHFSNYLSKYEEAARMHRELLHVSKLLETHEASIDAAIFEEASLNLDKGMCNCAYWHGVFGGLYLNYLRNAVYRNLIAAKRMLPHNDGAPGLCSADTFSRLRCGDIEIEVSCANGSIEAIDYLPTATRLNDVITRRFEGYHEKIAKAIVGANGGHDSIHNGVRAKEAGLQDALFYDIRPRTCFDVFIAAPDTTAERLMRGAVRLLETKQSGWRRTIGEREVVINGDVKLAGDLGSVGISKKTAIAEPSTLEMELAIQPSEVNTPFDAEIVVQFDFGLLAGDAPDRYYLLPQGRERMFFVGDVNDADSIALVDEWQGFAVNFSAEGGCTYRVYPIETVSASESGLERTYQGSSVNLCRSHRFEPNGEPFVFKFSLTVSLAG